MSWHTLGSVNRGSSARRHSLVEGFSRLYRGPGRAFLPEPARSKAIARQVFERKDSQERHETVYTCEELVEFVETAYELLPREYDDRLLRGAMRRYRSVAKLAKAVGETLARLIEFRPFRPGEPDDDE